MMNLSFFKYIIVFAVSMTLGFFYTIFFDEKPSDIELIAEDEVMEREPENCFNYLVSFIIYLVKEHKATLSDFQTFFVSHGTSHFEKLEKSDCAWIYPELKTIDCDDVYKIKDGVYGYPYFFVFKKGIFIKFLNPSFDDNRFIDYDYYLSIDSLIPPPDVLYHELIPH